jgi:hypothetical protein
MLAGHGLLLNFSLHGMSLVLALNLGLENVAIHPNPAGTQGNPMQTLRVNEGAAHARAQVLTIAGDRIAAVEAVADSERIGEFEVEVLDRCSPA